MITFLDEHDVEYGALATIKTTNAVNGERSLSGTIVSGDYVLSNIERGWRLRFDDEYYVVTYAKPVDEGRDVQVTFDAVHQFFWDFDKSSVYDQLSDGSHTFAAYLDFIFKKSGYSYTVDSALNVHAFEKQSFGLKKRLTLFNDIITSTGVEFQVNGKVVRILEKVGTDLSTVVRKNFNMNELTIEKNIGDFVTYQKGYGAYFDEENHSKGRLVAEYTSPLASVYGKLEAEPFVDERYKQSSSLLAVLKENVDNSYTISVSLDMEDLTRAGYKYKQPVAGDYIMAINETLDFQEKIRIVSFASEYDVQGTLVKHEVTCNDIGAVKKLSASYNLTKKQASSASATASNAYSIANKALVSADGKNTNYYTNSFPIDNPKGTLKTGDLLFLTVGDTVKQYYWNGTDWISNPVVNDVEAFKEQITEELKDVPNREEFENKISEELANSKAEIQTQIDTAKTQAESNAKAYADEINQATAEVAEQANAAANSLKSDLSKTKADLTATTTIANAAKTSASEAKQQLATVADNLSKTKTDLQNAVGEVDTKATNLQSDLTTAKQDLQAQASQLTAQANAQSELTKRVSSVEETAHGTKTTVSELSKTVDGNAKNISSVTARTKVVEDGLTSTKTTLSQVQTTANSTSQKAATLETGLNGLTAKFNSLSVGGANLFKGSRDFSGNWANGGAGVYAEDYQGVKIFKRQDLWGGVSQYFEVKTGEEYVFSAYVKSSAETDRVIFYLNHYLKEPVGGGTVSFGSNSGRDQIDLDLTDNYQRIAIKIKIISSGWIMPRIERFNSDAYLFFGGYKLERGNVATDYSPNEADIEQKVSEYKQTADQNYASLQTTVQNLDGTVQQNKATAEQTAQGFKTRIESLETYKDGETTRANQYFESAKTETARQLTAERTAIAKDYVAKSIYTSDVTGIRNDLTATTTTANTTKTNLANYQASNDRAVANLQSSLQATNGNVSSLQTKVEAVPGQITSAVSAVEVKIPTEVGSSNLLRNTAVNGDNLKLFGTSNSTINVVTKDGHHAYKIVVSTTDSSGVVFNGNADYFNLIKDRSYTFSFWVLTNKDKSYAFDSLGHMQVVSIDNGITGDDAVHQHTTPIYSTNNIKANIWTKVWCTFKAKSNSYFKPYFWYLKAGDEIYIYDMMLNEGKIPLSYTPAVEDTQSDITKLNTTLTQTANGLEQLSTQVTSQGNTITSHTNLINLLTTGLNAKVSQSDFNTLSGRVTIAENNITAKANELSSKITSVEGKIPTGIGAVNLFKGSRDFSGNWANGGSGVYAEDYQDVKIFKKQTAWGGVSQYFEVKAGEEYVFSAYVKSSAKTDRVTFYLNHYLKEPTAGGLVSFGPANNRDLVDLDLTDEYQRIAIKIKIISAGWIMPRLERGNNNAYLFFGGYKLERGNIATDWSPAPEDYDSKLASAQSEIKQTTDAIKASVSSLDNSTVKNASLTINTDGIVMKAGKSTTDVANAIGSYFAVNQNAINLFTDKINVKGNMIVSGAITSDKIASKSINTAHLNGKIITADVIATGAITADAIKSGAVTTDKMSANSINGDRITAGTLDAAKIKAGSITASQIASGTITSDQIKAGGISAANIATGSITADKIAANAIDVSKITGDTANFVKAAFKSLYSDLDITGESLKFNSIVGNSFEISNTNYLLKLNHGAHYAGINPLSYGGISIGMGIAALFSIRGVNRIDGSENIFLELDREHARIGTQTSYIRITNQKISIIKNNQVVQEY